jgi:hypothetical protein
MLYPNGGRASISTSVDRFDECPLVGGDGKNGDKEARRLLARDVIYSLNDRRAVLRNINNAAEALPEPGSACGRAFSLERVWSCECYHATAKQWLGTIKGSRRVRRHVGEPSSTSSSSSSPTAMRRTNASSGITSCR